MTHLVQKSCNVIGYWMSEKKRQKLNWCEFGNVCREHGFKLVKLDLNSPLEEQGPFIVILHKLTEVIVLASQGDLKAKEMIERVETYIKNHPEVAVIDPLENVQNLLDRYKSYSIIHNSELQEVDVFIPTFAELTSDNHRENLEKLKKAGVSFPFVCKPSVAHGSSDAHKMAIIFNEEGVKDCRPPCVAQSFINHNAILYKIYFVGDEHFVVERPSLKNFHPSDRKTIFFDTHHVSKADSTSSLSILDPGEEVPTITPNKDRLRRIVTILRKEFGMSLLGVDVVIENGTGRYGIIDINAYPGYDGVPNFFENLIKCIIQIVSTHSVRTVTSASDVFAANVISTTEFRSPSAKPQRNIDLSSIGDQDDSGFDTSDSSDEKKKQTDLSLARPESTCTK